MKTNQTANEEVFDARELPCEIKRPAVIRRCVDLPAGASYVLVNQHDPVPLRRHLDACYPGCFRWEHLAGADDDAVRIRVTKIAQLPRGQPAGVVDFSCH